MKQLFLGTGKEIRKPPFFETFEFGETTTVDINPDRNPDLVWDLNKRPLPFEDASFDQCFSFETLEHVGHLGNEIEFFGEFEEYWRILKPGGLFIASVPTLSSVWAFGDPGHKRVITLEMLSFLSQEIYKSCGPKSPTSDYRSIYHADFNVCEYKYYHDDWVFVFVLSKVSPIRKF